MHVEGMGDVCFGNVFTMANLDPYNLVKLKNRCM